MAGITVPVSFHLSPEILTGNQEKNYKIERKKPSGFSKMLDSY